jgi:hypothetical protein
MADSGRGSLANGDETISSRSCIWPYKTLFCTIYNTVYNVKFELGGKIGDMIYAGDRRQKGFLWLRHIHWWWNHVGDCLLRWFYLSWW